MIYAIFNISIIFLPLTMYLLNLSYNNNYKKRKNDYFLQIILILEVLLFIYFKDYTKTLILINVPLLISYLKRDELMSIILSILIGTYYVIILDYNVFFIFFEYVLYYVIFLIFRKKAIKSCSLISIFIFIKSIILAIEIFYFEINDTLFIVSFLDVFLRMIVFYLVSYLVLIFLLRGEEIMNLNTAIRELEKEKVLRTSLFKLTHEIKNPIAVCKGYLDMLDLSDIDKSKKYIPIVKSEIERTLTMMDDYLEYTKLEVKKDITDIYMLLSEVINSLELFFKENKIKIELNIPEEEELFLNLDYNRIKQVLYNMLKNSSEAYDLKKGGMIIKISTKVLKNKFVITIEDNGIGMDSETLDNVTNLFYTTKKNGTGLGTSLSKEIIELHGGKLKYQSEINKGTRAIITLPI